MSTEENMNHPQEQNLLSFEPHLVRADTGKRLANYIIDIIAFYAVFFVVGIIIALSSPGVLNSISDDAGGSLLDRLLSLILYAFFMSAIEAITKGRSLGKLITGTRAVNYDGTPISAGTAFARGFSRAVPFCVFSAFGTPCDPWQDRWTNTMVIDNRKSTLA